MKKILLSAIMLTALSFASFADEVKVKEVKIPEKTESKEVLIKKSGPVTCFGGITSCNTSYMLCFSSPVAQSIDLELAIWAAADAAAC